MKIQKKRSLFKWDYAIGPVLLGCILLITFLCYHSRLTQCISIDDSEYACSNPLVIEKEFDLKGIFTQSTVGVYTPLSILSYRCDKGESGFDTFQIPHPDPYTIGNVQIVSPSPPRCMAINATTLHNTNLLLHLFNTVLVFIVVLLLYYIRKDPSDIKWFTASFTAAVFALDPMHVESVAWVSERKDLLYAFFFLAAWVCYLFYLKRGTYRYLFFAGTMGFFFLSIISKGQAVVLPFILLLTDFYCRRNFSLKWVYEKIPLFAMGLAGGLYAIKTQQDANTATGTAGFFLPCYAFVTYLRMFFCPWTTLSFVHRYPYTPQSVPWHYMFYPVLITCILGFAVWFYRRHENRSLLFGIGGFIITMLPILQILAVGDVIVAERYTYVAFIFLAFGVADFTAYFKRMRTPAVAAALIFCAICIKASYNRVDVWSSSASFWQDAKEKSPCYRTYEGMLWVYANQWEFYRTPYALDSAYYYLIQAGQSRLEQNKNYGQLAARIYMYRGDYAKSIACYRELVGYKDLPLGDKILAYSRKAEVELVTRDFRSAIEDYKTCSSLDSAQAPIYYLGIGNAFANMGKRDSSVWAFQQVLSFDSANTTAYHNWVVALFLSDGENKRWINDSIIHVTTQYLNRNSNADMLTYRAVAYWRNNQFEKAFQDVIKLPAPPVGLDTSKLRNHVPYGH